jgi:NADH-quinone oxidoreductase subunit M
MNVFDIPWIEYAFGVALIGFIAVSRFRNPDRAYKWGTIFTGLTFAMTFMAWLQFYVGTSTAVAMQHSLQLRYLHKIYFSIDELNAPLIPAVAILHFLTALATSRAHMRRFSFSLSLILLAIRIATFSASDPWLLIGLFALSTVPAYFELLNRNRPKRLYVIHMALFIGLLVLGWGLVELAGGSSKVAPSWAIIPLLLAILIYSGTVPAHCWVTQWFENASLGFGLLYVVPLSGVYAVVRLVLPISPLWVLNSIGLLSLLTAVYSAAMSTIQKDTRRFFAYLFLSQASLVLVGLELETELSICGSLCLWFSVILSLGGFGLTIRALDARFGRLPMNEYHGLYEHSPALAVCFLLTGLASVGFPATLGFISTELVVDSAVESNPLLGFVVVVAAALNGIAIIRAYFSIFTGARHASTVSLQLGLRERIAVLTLAGLILGGGIFPQPGVTSRMKAAEVILIDRSKRFELEGEPRFKAIRAEDEPEHEPDHQ